MGPDLTSHVYLYVRVYVPQRALKPEHRLDGDPGHQAKDVGSDSAGGQVGTF